MEDPTNPPCQRCREPAAFPDAKKCTRCWELETRIEHSPQIAANILNQVGGYIVVGLLPWTDQVPVEPGNWWFHGWTHYNMAGSHDPYLRFVEVHWAGSGQHRHLIFVSEGEFLYSHQVAGLWLEAAVPDEPDLADVIAGLAPTNKEE